MGLPMNQKTIAKYYEKAHDEFVIVKPRLVVYNHRNLRHLLYLLQSEEPISSIEKVYSANKGLVSHVIGGGNAFNVFVRTRTEIDTQGFPVLFKDSCGDYIQTIPQRTCNESNVLDISIPLRRGKFPVNSKDELLKWDSMDWEIFEKISFDTYIPYSKIAKDLNVHQTTIKLRFVNRIKPNTYWLDGYFEGGYSSYTGVMIQTQTDYELGLYDRMSRLSSSAYFLKTFRDKLFILTYIRNVRHLVRYFNFLFEQKLVKEFKYSVCYDYLPR